jgi:hypothetical protein
VKVFLDRVSAAFSLCLSLLFLKHPTRTCLSVALGGFLSLLASVFSPWLQTVPHVDFSRVTLFHWLALGFMIGHAPLLRAYLTCDRSDLREEVREALELIRQGNFSPIERRRLYRQLIEKVTGHLALSAELMGGTRPAIPWTENPDDEPQAR